MSARSHLDLAEWRAFLEQTMGEADRDAALDHISSCPQCAGVFKSARTAALNVVGTPVVHDQRYRPFRILVPVAATLAIAVVSAIVMTRNAPPPASVVIDQPPVSPASPVAPVSPASPVTLVKPPVVIGAEQLLATRGDDDQSKYLQALADALRPYERDDFKAAIPLLERLVKTHSDRFEPVFYLGASLMMDGRAAEAVPVLERAVTIASAVRREDAERTLATARRAAQP
jgi:hypothetical protein